MCPWAGEVFNAGVGVGGGRWLVVVVDDSSRRMTLASNKEVTSTFVNAFVIRL